MRIRVVRTLGSLDRVTVGRDPMLRGLLAVPLVLALSIRFALPPILARLEVALGVALSPLYEPLFGFALLTMVPILAGTVVGFLLLDQRDDGTLVALRVTPLPLAGYVAYRLAMPMLLSVALTVALFPVAGLWSLGLPTLLAASLAAAPFAPVFALFLGSFAANKVQGFALMKAANLVLILPILAYFLDSGWTRALGLVPTYWPARAYWQLLAGQSTAWLYIAGGVLYQGVLAAVLLRRLARVMSR